MCYLLDNRRINTMTSCAFVYLSYDWETKTAFTTHKTTLNELSTPGAVAVRPLEALLCR